MTNLQQSSEDIWKDIQGYEGLYQISNLGKIKSLRRAVKNTGYYLIKKESFHYQTLPERILKNKTKSNGYHFVCLCKDGQLKYFHVHRLVAIAFLESDKDKEYVNHKDGVKGNNSVSNLEWVTASENNRHAISTGLKTSDKSKYNRGSKHYKSKPVFQFDIKGNFIKEWVSITEAAKFYNCCTNGISRVLLNKRGGRTCQGFKWRFNRTQS